MGFFVVYKYVLEFSGNKEFIISVLVFFCINLVLLIVIFWWFLCYEMVGLGLLMVGYFSLIVLFLLLMMVVFFGLIIIGGVEKVEIDNIFIE